MPDITWEYLDIDILERTPTDEDLDRYGKEGWELVTILATETGRQKVWIAYFKRQKRG